MTNTLLPCLTRLTIAASRPNIASPTITYTSLLLAFNNFFNLAITYYYKYKGEVNTDHVLEVAVRRALEHNIKSVIVASETGRSALKALSIIKKNNLGIKLVVVTHPPNKTWGPKGDIPIASASRSLSWNKALPDTIIDMLLGGVFGQGLKIAIEVALMATDSGAVDRGELVVSLGGTFKGLDTAIVAKTTYSYYFLTEFELLEIIAKPWKPRITYPEYKDPNWKGNLNKYYENVTVLT